MLTVSNYTPNCEGGDAGLFFVPALQSKRPLSVGCYPGATFAGTQAQFTVEDVYFMARLGDPELFFSSLKRMPNGCLEWQLSTNQDGYGLVRRRGIRNSFIHAHRYAWYLEHGRWPEPQALHYCDNPPCCDLTHLYEGTQQDNVRDMMERDRHARKFSSQIVEAVRTAKGTYDEIAARFQISLTTVWRFRTGNLNGRKNV